MSIDPPSPTLPCLASPQERTTPLPPLRTHPEPDCSQEAKGEAPSGSDSLRSRPPALRKIPLDFPSFPLYALSLASLYGEGEGLSMALRVLSCEATTTHTLSF